MTTHRRGGEAAIDQVSRMLALVPYIAQRPGTTIADLAQEFRVSAEQITSDLNLLMVCGEPGYYPNELIDVVFDDDDGAVSIAYDAGLDRPIRLRPDEAVTLTAALRALGDVPDLLDAEAVHSALAKLEMVGTDTIPAIAITGTTPSPLLGTVREAIDLGRRLRLCYYTASRDALTERAVDPIRVLVVDGHAYLEGYCYLTEAVRRFRIDRIDEAEILAVNAQPTLWVSDDMPTRMFTPSREAAAVTLNLAPRAAWVAEYYVLDGISELADPAGWIQVRLRAADDEWIIRLVLSLGGAARVVDAPEIAAEVSRRAEAALAAYPS